MTRSLSFALAALVISHASATGAQAPEETREPGEPLTAILQTEVPEPALADFGAALQRVLRAELRSLEVVDIAGTPALGLEDIRLMVGCLSDTPECFEAFAAQLEVEALLLPSLARAGDAYVVSLVFFDGAEVHEVTRQASEEQVEENLVGGLGGMLRELFGLPPEEAAGPVVTDLDAGGATGTVTGTASTSTSRGADGEAP
ncbi:MAG TPA: hypothetical protein RMG45_11220, partial [Polyangiaceae bacterium LLY-WYZ-15_(1-7)]|nr:hypothetical protein [Polyangiaceae bacterium LLY-WYZ-15_(1-7)]